MKFHINTISIAVAAALLFPAAAGFAQLSADATGQYREAYMSLQEALKLEYENKKDEALLRYEEAKDRLENLLLRFPDVNRETIEARVAKCQEAIDKLNEELSVASPAAEPAGETAEFPAATAPPAQSAGTLSGEGGDEASVTEPPQRAAVAFTRVPEDLEGEKERSNLLLQLRTMSSDLEKTREEKEATEADLEKARAEIEKMRSEILNINTSLGMAIADLEKEREVKVKIEEEAMKAQSSSEEVLKAQLAQALQDKEKIEADAMKVQTSSEEVLKAHLAQAIADKKKIETEAMEAYRASEEIMQDQLQKQKEEHLQTLEAERLKTASEKGTAGHPIEQLQSYIDAYKQEVENARSELNESLKLLASSQETHRKLLEANRDLEKRIASLSDSVTETEKEAELVDLRKAAEAEEEKLRTPDISRGPSPPAEARPAETQVLAGEISEKNDEYGKVFIDFAADVKEGEDLLVVRDNEVIARLTVSKVFPSIKGGIANVIPKEDAFELREKDKVYASRRDTSAPSQP